MTHGSLFAGIGGFDLGFERAGIKTVWQVEIDAYCRRVLAKHFPDAQRFADIRKCSALPWVDVISGGFPCQDISNAGKRAGIEGEHSGLWSEFARIVRELRPRYVVVENVAALLGRGMGRVLGDLAEIGYDAEWQCIRASDVGAPHIRDRIWIVASPAKRRTRPISAQERQGVPDAGGCCADVADTQCDGRQQGSKMFCEGKSIASHSREDVPDAECLRWVRWSGIFEAASKGGRLSSERNSWWDVEPDVGRVAHGIPARVDRLRGLGNAVVPQIAEYIGRAIVAATGE